MPRGARSSPCSRLYDRRGRAERPRVLHHYRALSADRRERRHEHCSCYARARDERGQVWGSIVSWRLDGPAEHEGFGISLVRRLVTGQFGGQLSYDWKPKGLIIRLSMPVERLTT